jgi:LacI family transcriptional regulator
MLKSVQAGVYLVSRASGHVSSRCPLCVSHDWGTDSNLRLWHSWRKVSRTDVVIAEVQDGGTVSRPGPWSLSHGESLGPTTHAVHERTNIRPAGLRPKERELLMSGESAARRVTQRDVAASAGLHSTTVSLALRGSSKISPITRERVRQVASSIGYVPDPRIGAFVAHREKVFGRCGRETIAFVTFCAGEAAANGCLEGVRARAADFGFKVDHIVGGGTNRSHRRWRQILYHRGIKGVILYYADDYVGESADLGEDRLSVVAVGPPDSGLRFHRVAFNCFGAIRTALCRARQMGYRRIGLVSTCEGYALCMRAIATDAASAKCDGDEELVTLCVASRVCCEEAKVSEVARLARWMRIHQPEVILGVARDLRTYFHALGLRLPGDVSLLDFDRDESDPSLAGVVHNRRAIGSVAFDVLHRLIRQNTPGVPPVATRTLVDGVWHRASSRRP